MTVNSKHDSSAARAFVLGNLGLSGPLCALEQAAEVLAAIQQIESQAKKG